MVDGLEILEWDETELHEDMLMPYETFPYGLLPSRLEKTLCYIFHT